MPKIFLDACIFIDIISNRQAFDLTALEGNRPAISALTIHIAHYVAKATCPDQAIINLASKLIITSIPLSLAHRAMFDPTTDYEDNLQLLSALEAQCDLFITDDKTLLKLKKIKGLQIIHPTELAKYL